MVDLEKSFLKSVLFRGDKKITQAFDYTQKHLGIVVNRKVINQALDKRLKDLASC